MAPNSQQTFDALSDAHYQTLGKILVIRNEFIHRCASILLVAQFGIVGRGIAGQASFLHAALSCDSVSEMTERVRTLLSSCDDKTLGPRFVSVVQPHERLLEEVDRLIAGRWGLVDFTQPEKPVLYAVDRVNLPSYSASDIERVLCAFKELYAALKPFLYPPDVQNSSAAQ